MFRRASIIGTAGLALLLTATHGGANFNQAADSARSFRYYFEDLKGADSGLNPVERVVYSLLLTRTEESGSACAKPRPIRAASRVKSATTRM